MLLVFSQVGLRDKRVILLEDFNFQLKSGEIAAILGRSQTGKSTLLLMAANVISPTSGSIRVLREDAPAESAEKPNLKLIGLGPIEGYAPLFDTLTVQEQLKYQGEIYGIRSVGSRVDQLLKQYDLADVRKKRVKDLDKYSYFRTALAAVQIHRPSFVLLDEPEKGLSQLEWMQAKQHLIQAASEGIGILFTTVLESVASEFDRVIRLPGGEVVHNVRSNSAENRDQETLAQ